MTAINLNARIRVGLTPHGFAIHHKHWNDVLRYSRTDVIPRLKDGDIWEGELWDFAHIFGSHLYNGCTPVTVGTDLTVVSPS